jgi:hypothetical protein
MHPCTATCPTAPDPASLPRRALALPHVPWLWTLPPCSRGLRCCHMSHGSGPRLPAWEGSGAATYRMALDPASLLERALVLPCAPRLRTWPPYSGGLRCCHVPHSSGPRLPARGGSGAVTCTVTLTGQCALIMKKGLAATTCSKAHMFPRHAPALPRGLQDVRANDVIMTCKPCGQTLQDRATVQRRATDCLSRGKSDRTRRAHAAEDIIATPSH